MGIHRCLSWGRSSFLLWSRAPRSGGSGPYSRNPEHIRIHDNSIKNRSDCQYFSEKHGARIRTISFAAGGKYCCFHRKAAKTCRKQHSFMQNSHCSFKFFARKILQIRRIRDRISPDFPRSGFRTVCRIHFRKLRFTGIYVLKFCTRSDSYVLCQRTACRAQAAQRKRTRIHSGRHRGAHLAGAGHRSEPAVRGRRHFGAYHRAGAPDQVPRAVG